MKHLMTLLALVVAVTAGAQGTTIYEYPWNPDWDNDNFVGSSDLTGFLSAFGSEFGNPPEPCDYDGTELEDFIFGWFDGSIVVDSLFVEYEIQDVASYYVFGCPDPIIDTVILSNFAMLNEFGWYGDELRAHTDINGDAFGSYLQFVVGYPVRTLIKIINHEVLYTNHLKLQHHSLGT